MTTAIGRGFLSFNERNSANTTKTLNVKASAYYADGASIFTDVNDAWNTARSFTASSSGTVYVKVDPYPSGYTGTFGIVYSADAAMPGVTFYPNATSLTVNVWKDGEITNSETEAWHSFTVVGENTYYVWWNDSYSDTSGNRIKTLNVSVSAFYDDGTAVTAFSNVETAWNTARSFTAALSGTVYLRVTPASYYPGQAGTYGIVYNTANTRPNATISPANAVPLTANQWANGQITASNGEAWYSFTVTSGTTYRVWGDGSGNGLFKTLQNMSVGAWYGNGNNIFYNIDSLWTFGRSFTANSNGTVYVRVYSGTPGNTGTFGIVYSAATTRPDVPFNPDEIPNLTALTAGQWADGQITGTGAGRAVWYSFAVTSGNNYYLWSNESGGLYDGDGTKTLDSIDVSAYYSDGTNIFSNASGAWESPQEFTANSSGTVYVRVTPFFSTGAGTFGIVYSTTNTRPAVN